MDQVQFALWRFRNAEGVMDYVKKWDLNSCTMTIGKETILITYNMANETIIITRKDDPYSMPINTTFKEFVATMKSLGFYKERSRINRHSLSYKSEEEANAAQ